MRPHRLYRGLPYDAGYDAGRNGPDIVNSHFTLFATRESTREWERGNRAGKVAALLAGKPSDEGPKKEA